jgi:hypothetical protein
MTETACYVAIEMFPTWFSNTASAFTDDVDSIRNHNSAVAQLFLLGCLSKNFEVLRTHV